MYFSIVVLIMSFSLWTFASLLIEFLIKDGWIPFIKGCFVITIFIVSIFNLKDAMINYNIATTTHSTPHHLWPKQMLYLSLIIQAWAGNSSRSTTEYCLVQFLSTHKHICMTTLWRPIFIANDFLMSATRWHVVTCSSVLLTC